MTTAIIEKVQKLLALSKSSNANEAAAAANAANKLIDTYRLSEADLECMTETGEPIEEDTDYIYESGKVTPWKRALVHHLVKHYGCVHWNDTSYATGRQVSRYRLVGRRSDIGIAKFMFAYLTAECQRLANIEAKGKGRVFVGSYCQGFVNGIAIQLELSRNEAKKDATSTAIVKLNAREEEAKAAMYKMHTNLCTVKSNSQARTDFNAFYKGQIQGQNTHLGSSLTASGGTRMLGK